MKILSTVTSDTDFEGESYLCEATTPLQAAKKFLRALKLDATWRAYRGETKTSTVCVFREEAKDRKDALKLLAEGSSNAMVMEHSDLEKSLLNRTFYLPLHAYAK
jgi:hypothetical protein